MKKAMLCGLCAILGLASTIGARQAQGPRSPSLHRAPADPWQWVEETKLVASGREPGDWFGKAAALDGDTALIGAPGEDDAGISAGRAYVFARAGTAWGPQQELLGSDTVLGDSFGAGVALDGDTALVGAPWKRNGGTLGAGAVYVFVRSGTIWTQQARLRASDGDAAAFGDSVALDGDTALVGAAGENPGTNVGSAYVFIRTGTTWSEQARLLASDGQSYDLFGISVALEGDTALIGTVAGSAPGAPDAGAAYVFTRTGSIWAERTKLVANDASDWDGFGASVALSGTTALLGAGGDDPAGILSGSSYVFVGAGSSWSQQAKLVAADAEPFDGFHQVVGLEGDTAVIGVAENDQSNPGPGSAYVFVRTGTTWTEQAKLNAADGEVYDAFGWSVSVSSDSILVGAGIDDTGAGSAYVFRWTALAAATFRNDAGGTNPTGYLAGPPVMGADWIATVDNTGTTSFVAGVMGFVQPLELFLPHAGGYLLVDPTDPAGELLGLPPAYGYGAVEFRVPIPMDASLCGFGLATQGAGLGGADGVKLHNAYDLFVGM